MASISAPDLDRNQRIKAILDEVKREKPLGKCPLFKMSLTFRSFVWASVVDNLYGSSAMDEIEKPSTVVKTVPPKKLQRSQSAASITSNAPSTHTIEHNPGSNLPHQVSLIQILDLTTIQIIFQILESKEGCYQTKYAF